MTELIAGLPGQRGGDDAAVERHSAEVAPVSTTIAAVGVEQAEEVVGVRLGGLAGFERRLAVLDPDRGQRHGRLVAQLLVEAVVEPLAQPEVEPAAEEQQSRRQQRGVPERQAPADRQAAGHRSGTRR